MHPGKKTMTFEVFDMKEKVKLAMPSRRQKVNISQELLHELDEQQVKYKLN
jgi:DNA polymerase-3 subunit alpha